MNLRQELNPQQRRAVLFGDRPLLVLAGPGTGKTRVVTYRAAHLIESGRARPDQLLVLTFTNKAAQTLLERVNQLLGASIGAEMWVGTYHHTCVRILREHAAALGLPEDFAIFDQETQEILLIEALREAGLEADPAMIARLRTMLRYRKIHREDPLRPELWDELGDDLLPEDPARQDRYRLALELYQKRLGQYGGLDFDDLLSETVQRLREHPAVVEQYRQRFRYFLIDEYQDINGVQYDLVRLLASEPYRITAVGDEDQSIYSWRGSGPEWIQRFQEEYRPEVIQLDQHYRSTRTILHAAEELISKNERIRTVPLRTDNPVGQPIYFYWLPDEREEAKLVVQLVRRLHRRAHIAYRDIAVFYRNHRYADAIEQRLTQAGIPVQRLRPSHHLLNPEERHLLAWLMYLVFDLDLYLPEALAHPLPVLDEWWSAWFRWRAGREGVALSALLGDPPEEVGPLTRRWLALAWEEIRSLRSQVRTSPPREAVRLVIAALERLRPPLLDQEAAELPRWEAFPHLMAAVRLLDEAIRRGRPIWIRAAPTLDAQCAAQLLRRFLTEYLGALLWEDSADAGPTGPLEVRIGPQDEASEPVREAIWLGGPEAASLLWLCPRAPARYPNLAAWLALQLAQCLLARREEDAPADLVVYDLETTGNDFRRSEILEFAATRLSRPEQHEHLFIRPVGGIPAFSTRIHGITEETVRDKPTIAEQIPRIRQFLGDAILIGHNVAEFDNRFLEREAERHLGEPLSNPVYDTLEVARRLYPRESHQLRHLTEKFGIGYEMHHRAHYDVEATKHLFYRLRSESFRRRALRSLGELLPYVAVAMLDLPDSQRDSLAPYLRAAARLLTRGDGATQGVFESLPVPMRAKARQWLEQVRRMPRAEADEERRWQDAVARFRRRVQRFEETDPAASIRDFLNAQALIEPVDTWNESADAVTLMTLHTAKGTEFRAVLLTGMEQGIFPPSRAIGNPERMAEERRLCYVGMTRAQQRLYFLGARRRNGWERNPSCFLSEIPSNLLRRWSPRRRRASLKRRR